MSLLQYGCTIWTLTKRKKLDDYYTWMLHAVLNKSWKQHPWKQQLYSHLPPISKIIQVSRTIHTRHCWRISCLNFWDEACWFLSLRVFGLFSSSLVLFPQRFGWYVLRLSSGVCRTREPSRNSELRPLLHPRGSPVLIPLAITGYKC